MTNHDLNLDIRNAEAISRAEDRSLLEPMEVPRNPFAPPLSDEDGYDDDWVRALRWS